MSWNKLFLTIRHEHAAVLRVVVVLFIGLVGTWLLYQTHASTQSFGSEVEKGKLGTCSENPKDTTASNSRAVKFDLKGGSCWIHPGVLVTKSQLDTVKAHIAHNDQPWANAYNDLKTSDYGQMQYAGYNSITRGTLVGSGHPPSNPVDCLNNPDECDYWVADGVAAYTQALLYYLTPTSDSNKYQYARNGVDILNNYAANLTSFSPITDANNNTNLRTAWAGEDFTKAAELLRYTYTPAPGKPALDVAGLSTMFNLFLPELDWTLPAAYHSLGNWHASMVDAKLGIAVFTENRALFKQSVSEWTQRLPAYIYLTSDGIQPANPPQSNTLSLQSLRCTWDGVPVSQCTGSSVASGFAFTDGQSQEQCRDTTHPTMGLDALTLGAETAYIQGVNLFQNTSIKAQERLTKAYEKQAAYDKAFIQSGRLTFPTSPCGGPPTQQDDNGRYGDAGVGSERLSWEVINYHYTVEEPVSGLQFDNVHWMIGCEQPTQAANHMMWETLTDGVAVYPKPAGC